MARRLASIDHAPSRWTMGPRDPILSQSIRGGTQNDHRLCESQSRPYCFARLTPQTRQHLVPVESFARRPQMHGVTHLRGRPLRRLPVRRGRRHGADDLRPHAGGQRVQAGHDVRARQVRHRLVPLGQPEAPALRRLTATFAARNTPSRRTRACSRSTPMARRSRCSSSRATRQPVRGDHQHAQLQHELGRAHRKEHRARRALATRDLDADLEGRAEHLRGPRTAPSARTRSSISRPTTTTPS